MTKSTSRLLMRKTLHLHNISDLQDFNPEPHSCSRRTTQYYCPISTLLKSRGAISTCATTHARSCQGCNRNTEDIKRSGVGEIAVELLKIGLGNIRTATSLHELLNLCPDETMLEDWHKSVICLTYKKGDELCWEKYRER